MILSSFQKIVIHIPLLLNSLN